MNEREGRAANAYINGLEKLVKSQKALINALRYGIAIRDDSIAIRDELLEAYKDAVEKLTS